MTKYIVPNLYRRFDAEELVSEKGKVGLVLETENGRQFFEALPVEESEIEETPETAALKEQVDSMLTKALTEGWHYNISMRNAIRKDGEGEVHEDGTKALTFEVTNRHPFSLEDLKLIYDEEEYWDERGSFCFTADSLKVDDCLLAVSTGEKFVPVGLAQRISVDAWMGISIHMVPPVPGMDQATRESLGRSIISLASAPLVAITRPSKNYATAIFQASSAVEINGFFFTEEEAPHTVIRRKVFEMQLGELNEEDGTYKFVPGFSVPGKEE